MERGQESLQCRSRNGFCSEPDGGCGALPLSGVQGDSLRVVHVTPSLLAYDLDQDFSGTGHV